MSSSPLQNELPAHAATAPPVGASQNSGKRDAKKYGTGKSKSGLRAHDTAAEIVASLMKAPKSLTELEDVLGLSHQTLRKYMLAFRRSGVVYEACKAHARCLDGRVREGRLSIVYAMQSTPFERPDSAAPRS